MDEQMEGWMDEEEMEFYFSGMCLSISYLPCGWRIFVW